MKAVSFWQLSILRHARNQDNGRIRTVAASSCNAGRNYNLDSRRPDKSTKQAPPNQLWQLRHFWRSRPQLDACFGIRACHHPYLHGQGQRRQKTFQPTCRPSSRSNTFTLALLCELVVTCAKSELQKHIKDDKVSFFEVKKSLCWKLNGRMVLDSCLFIHWKHQVESGHVPALNRSHVHIMLSRGGEKNMKPMPLTAAVCGYTSPCADCLRTREGF